ncbi:hypothetical protein DFH08DRAFT_960403 [Mycena albidolilacea]|uniref:Uncharacterized protein n=1 Tax=Mycena albidolilacea TaxID=1033008 RepID=A0AAD7A268_9AGAR|nr:hypothetical protein DFH08DRAFT_960403 [Mycena albidolilacea]
MYAHRSTVPPLYINTVQRITRASSHPLQVLLTLDIARTLLQYSALVATNEQLRTPPIARFPSIYLHPPLGPGGVPWSDEHAAPRRVRDVAFENARAPPRASNSRPPALCALLLLSPILLHPNLRLRIGMSRIFTLQLRRWAPTIQTKNVTRALPSQFTHLILSLRSYLLRLAARILVPSPPSPPSPSLESCCFLKTRGQRGLRRRVYTHSKLYSPPRHPALSCRSAPGLKWAAEADPADDEKEERKKTDGICTPGFHPQ